MTAGSTQSLRAGGISAQRVGLLVAGHHEAQERCGVHLRAERPLALGEPGLLRVGGAASRALAGGGGERAEEAARPAPRRVGAPLRQGGRAHRTAPGGHSICCVDLC